METLLFIWLASNIGYVAGWLGGIVTFLFFANVALWVIFPVYAIDHSKEENSKFRAFNFRTAKWSIPLALFLSLMTAILPSERTLYLMAGGYFGQQVVQSEQVGKVVKIIDIKLDEYLKEADEKINKVKEK